MSENNQPSVDQIPSELLTLTSEQWETAGMTPAGKVGFKIVAATLEAGQKRNPNPGDKPWPVANLEVLITERPDKKVNGKGERHWERMRLDGHFLKRFKALAAAAGIKIQKGSNLSLAEVVKALNGRPAFGTIIHRSWKSGDASGTSAEFANKFGKDFSALA